MKKKLYSAGISINRISQDPTSPIELSDLENEIVQYVRSHNLSMCTTLNLYQTAVACKYIVKNKIPGDFVECGVFRGGNALIAARIFEIHKSEKKVYLFDTFSGMTEPTKFDVSTSTNSPVLNKYLSAKRDNFTDWAYAPIEEVKENFKKANLLNDNVIFIQGKVEDTLNNSYHNFIFKT